MPFLSRRSRYRRYFNMSEHVQTNTVDVFTTSRVPPTSMYPLPEGDWTFRAAAMYNSSRRGTAPVINLLGTAHSRDIAGGVEVLVQLSTPAHLIRYVQALHALHRTVRQSIPATPHVNSYINRNEISITAASVSFQPSWRGLNVILRSSPNSSGFMPTEHVSIQPCVGNYNREVYDFYVAPAAPETTGFRNVSPTLEGPAGPIGRLP